MRTELRVLRIAAFLTGFAALAIAVFTALTFALRAR